MVEREILEHINKYMDEGKSMFVSSSFQSHSIPLLHLLSRIDKSIPIMFINTGYLFPETVSFKDEVSQILGMKVQDVRSMIPKSHQRDANGNLLFTTDPDRCCYMNKVQALEPILAQYDIWINGVRASQNANRASMLVEQDAGFNCKRFHPILDWTDKEIYEYRMRYDLPEHPLESQGFFSIGCEPCTLKMDLDTGRDGRWYGMNKTECGLHLDLKRD